MLKDHVYFIAKVNIDVAKRLRERIMGEICSFEQMPERFPYLDDDNQRCCYRKMIVPDWYMVIYLVIGDTVFIEYILDGQQDYSWLFYV